MTDLERALAAGGKAETSDLDRALAAGGVADETDDEAALRESFLRPGGKRPLDRIGRANQAYREGVAATGQRAPGNLELAAKSVGDVGNSLIDTATAGGYKALLHLGGRLPVVGDTLEGAARGIEDYRTSRPVISQFSDAPAAFVGAPEMLAKSVAAGLGTVTRGAPAVVGRFLASRPVSGGLAGAATGGAMGTAQAMADGEDVADSLKAGGKAALIGGALGAGAGALAAGSEALRGKLRDPRGELGRSIASLEKAKASGILEDPSFKALKRGAPGANEVAAEAEANIAGRNEAQVKAAGEEYAREQARILAKHGDTLHYVPDAEAALNAAEQENTINGVVGDEKLASAIGKVKRMLTFDTGVVSSGEKPDTTRNSAVPKVETITAPAVKVGDLLKTKRIVDSLAEFGMPATPENVPYRKISSVLGGELENIDPELKALNQRYHQAMGKAEETNLLMYGADAPRISKTPAKTRQAVGMFGRVGDETQAATLREPQIARLAELDPGNAADIARVEAKKAVERTRYGLPRVSRRIEHMPFGFVEQNASALGARVVDPALGVTSRARVSPETIAAGLGMTREARRRRKEKRE